MADALQINGNLAPYQFLNGTHAMQLHILSGNWSMAMNDTAVFDFNANFTMVRSDGLERRTFSLSNLTAVKDLDIMLTNSTMSLRSALDYHAGSETTRVNATFTVQKLNVIVIEMDDIGTPINGVVDKFVRIENGQTPVMHCQFEMI